MNKTKWIPGLILLCLLVAGCATTQTRFDTVNTKMETNLNYCLGKLTQDRLIMGASTPTERISVNDGEIWIYKYRKSTTKTTTTGTGGVFSPFESESKSYDYYLDVRLRFNNNGILDDWSYKGNIAAFDHPFTNLRCQ